MLTQFGEFSAPSHLLVPGMEPLASPGLLLIIEPTAHTFVAIDLKLNCTGNILHVLLAAVRVCMVKLTGNAHVIATISDCPLCTLQLLEVDAWETSEGFHGLFIAHFCQEQFFVRIVASCNALTRSHYSEWNLG